MFEKIIQVYSKKKNTKPKEKLSKKFANEMSTTCLNPLEIWIMLECKTKKTVNQIMKIRSP